MKNLALIFLCFFYFININSQNRTQRDTIYYFFETNNHQTKIKNFYQVKGQDELYNYELKFMKEQFVNLCERKYRDFDDQSKKKEMPSFWVKKSFLKTKKIFYYNDLESKSIEDIYSLFRNNVIFLIDKKEMKNKKYLVKEVLLGNCSYTPEE